MLSKKNISKDVTNIMITKAIKEQPVLHPLKKKLHQILRNCQPQHWFDGFMDDVSIELKDLK